MLDRHAPHSSGSAVLAFEQRGERAVESRLHWRSVDIWRVEKADAVIVSSGQQVFEWSGRQRPRARPARPGHPAWDLQMIFPLRAHIWGRQGDDYYMADTRETDLPNAVRVQLAGIEDGRTGWIDVDMTTGCIVAADYNGNRLWLHDYSEAFGPLPDELFTAGEN
jgi:hypothetical protein